MKILKANYTILEQQNSDNAETFLENMFKHIEICGRTCYKSEDKITNDSYIKFVKMLEDAKHGAMLEHGTVYLTIPLGDPLHDPQYIWKMDLISFFIKNKYSMVKKEVINETVNVEVKGIGMKAQASATFYYITTNWRVIFNAKQQSLVKYALSNYHLTTESLEQSVLQWITPPTDKHERRYTVQFTYNLAVARDINRHRVHSIGEESTRYCNYAKEKFGKELNIIEPVWFTDDEKKYLYDEDFQLSLQELCGYIAKGDDTVFNAIDYWKFANLACEYAYMMNTTKFGWTPQQGSLMLPLDTKTTSNHTAFVSDWCHFFNLRALGTTGSPRPSAKEVAWPLMEEFLSRGWITLDMIDSQKYMEIKNQYPDIHEYIKK